MKKLMAVAVLALALGGCKTSCNDYTIFPCKDRCCRTVDPVKCDCNHKEKCCEYLRQPEHKVTVSSPRE